MQSTKLYIASAQHHSHETIAAPRSYDAFFQTITTSTRHHLTESEKYMLMDTLQHRHLRKRQYFTQEGEACRQLGFVLKGAARTYSVNHKGQETILRFNTEKTWLGDRESFRTGRPSSYHIEALEHTELLTASLNGTEELAAAIPAFRQFLEHDHYCQLAFSQLRLDAALSMNAEERYLDLLTHWPEYAKRFSQHMIACYLGIKPETLSRIRKNWQAK